MKIRDLIIFGAAATSMVAASAVSMADEAKPLAAGGPAAQSEAGLAPGTIVEIGGVLFAVTVAGLVAVNADSNSDSTPPAPTTSTTTTTSTT